MSKRLLVVVLVFVTLGMVFTVEAKKDKPVKNIIILIPDGMSLPQTSIARWYNDGAPLAMDEIACGLVRTFNADSPIADSAPAGTAFATGHKSHTGYVGVMPDVADMYGMTSNDADKNNQPLTTILEAARLLGKSTGLIATSEISHATPADFSAHFNSRKSYDNILEQQVYNNIDVVFGGGYTFLLPENRKDKEDLTQVLRSRGYSLIRTRSELLNFKTGKVWGMFAEKDMAYDFDRPENEPSIEEMTKKAIELLSQNNKGFFLMVEGSKIDWAAHANDPIGIISDVLAFDKAVKAALDFAKKDKNTIVIVVSDHGNGGMSMGDYATSTTYDKEPLKKFITPLKKAKLTGEGIERLVAEKNIPLYTSIADYYGYNDFDEKDLSALKKAKKGELNYVVGPMISKMANIGWTTNGHTGEEVVLYVYHPTGNRPTGVIDNTRIGTYMAEMFGTNLDDLTKTLYIPAKTAFESVGATMTLDTSDKENPVIVAQKGSKKVMFPIQKDIAVVDGKTVQLKSLTVFNGKDYYISQEAANLLK